MNNSKTSLFLMELIIVILLFSICGGICVQLFFNTHTTDEVNLNTTHANLITQNLSEAFLGCDGNLGNMIPLFENSTLDSNSSNLSIYYDESWNAISNEKSNEAKYVAAVSVSSPSDTSEAGGYLLEADITVSEVLSDSSISTIMANKVLDYIPYRLEDK